MCRFNLIVHVALVWIGRPIAGRVSRDAKLLVGSAVTPAIFSNGTSRRLDYAGEHCTEYIGCRFLATRAHRASIWYSKIYFTASFKDLAYVHSASGVPNYNLRHGKEIFRGSGAFISAANITI